MIDLWDEPEEMAPSESQRLADIKDAAKAKSNVSAVDLLARKAPPPRPAKPPALRSSPSETGSGSMANKSAKGGAPPLPSPRSRNPSGSSTSSPLHPLAQMQTLSDQIVPTSSTFANKHRATPSSFSNNNTPSSDTSASSKQAALPPLPRRKGTGASSLRSHSASKRRSTADSDVDYDPLSGPRRSDSGRHSPPAVNKKVDVWRRRLQRAHDTLDHIGVRLYTWRRGDDVTREAEGIVREAMEDVHGGGK